MAFKCPRQHVYTSEFANSKIKFIHIYSTSDSEHQVIQFLILAQYVSAINDGASMSESLPLHWQGAGWSCSHTWQKNTKQKTKAVKGDEAKTQKPKRGISGGVLFTSDKIFSIQL